LIENFPSGPVVNSGAPPACITIAPSIGAVPSVTTPPTENLSGNESVVPLDVEEIVEVVVVEIVTVDAPPPPAEDEPADPPTPSGSEEHAGKAKNKPPAHQIHQRVRRGINSV
jgi:hypothetical protein